MTLFSVPENLARPCGGTSPAHGDKTTQRPQGIWRQKYYTQLNANTRIIQIDIYLNRHRIQLIYIGNKIKDAKRHNIVIFFFSLPDLYLY